MSTDARNREELKQNSLSLALSKCASYVRKKRHTVHLDLFIMQSDCVASCNCIVRTLYKSFK